MKNQKSKKLGFMAMKLDMSKAYDRMEWSYLVKIMEKLEFCEKWVSLVYECINMVSYKILVNGEPRGDIRPSRGIRQGDPLSPYFFLLCLESLNRMLQQAASNDSIRGFSLCKRGPSISHLFFTNDSLLFCRATMSDLLAVQDIFLCMKKLQAKSSIGRRQTSLLAK